MTAPSAHRDPYPSISDYALIGNCHAAALVHRSGSIDWYCPVRFDAPAVFCRMLDAGKGGFLSVTPVRPATVKRRYLPNTALLETVLECEQGRVRLVDAMPFRGRPVSEMGQDVQPLHGILRLIEGLEGDVEIELAVKPTLGYAGEHTECRIQGDTVRAAGGTGQILIVTCRGADFGRRDDGAVSARMRVGAGDRRWLLVRSPDESGDPDPLDDDSCGQMMRETESYWQRWSGSCTFRGRHREAVLRSAITLKMLTYEPTGAIVAAPTTSLPELIGGARNWDYRFTWLRDSTLILFSLMPIGYQGEAVDFLRWLVRTCGNDPTARPQIMYTIDGGTDIQERTLDWLDGYRGSKPVRVGNGAATQVQLDIYGEIMLAADVHFGKHGPAVPQTDGARRHNDSDLLQRVWPLLRGLVDQAAAQWADPDEGIWEVRGGPQPFLFGKLMCWAALDRGLHLARTHGIDAPSGWTQTEARIRRAILDEGFNRRLGAFTQSLGSDVLDASTLIIPTIGFLPATDPRVLSTVTAIRERLTANDFVYRYRTPDGLAGGEGTFTLCTFWLIDALAMSGQLDEASRLYEHMLSVRNDVGLLSEEIDPSDGSMLGNFPQGFSHLAMIRSALNLAKAARHGPEHRAESPGQRASKVADAAAST